jgi:uncharacterized membrane protein YoaK (UPF0700 family)
MSIQAIFYLLCILAAFAGAFVAGVLKVWTTALAFLVVALFVLAFAWPVLTG